jgi:hypothetical protein
MSDTDMPVNPATGEPAKRVNGYVTLTADQRWGWGTTIAEAAAQCKKAGARTTRKDTRLTVKLPDGALDAYVDQMGQVRWDWADDAPDKTLRGDLVEIPK